jgi:Tfp pilus assembly protein PilF
VYRIDWRAKLPADQYIQGGRITSARTFRDELRRALVEQEYLNGLRAFQRRQLDTAIVHFDRALEIDPSHRNANVNRAQVLELQSTTR